jgi:hypothetical protein
MPRQKSFKDHMTLLHENPRLPTVLRPVIERLDSPHLPLHARTVEALPCLPTDGCIRRAKAPNHTAPRLKRASAMSNGWYEAARGELSAKFWSEICRDLEAAYVSLSSGFLPQLLATAAPSLERAYSFRCLEPPKA